MTVHLDSFRMRGGRIDVFAAVISSGQLFVCACVPSKGTQDEQCGHVLLVAGTAATELTAIKPF